MFGFLTTLVAKFTSLGIVAQAATGVTIAVASVGGVAAAGALPAPMQNAVSSVVSSVTSSSPSGTSTSGTTDSSTPASDSAEPTEAGDTAAATSASASASATPSDTAAPSHSLPSQASFGQSVAALARSGAADGQTISGMAHAAHQPTQQPTTPSASASASASATPSAPTHGRPSTVGTGRP